MLLRKVKYFSLKQKLKPINGGSFMAFVNKKLTKEEREEFKARQIIDFFRTLPGHSVRYLDPFCVTIDEEKDVYLILLGARRDELKNKFFALVISEMLINFVLTYEGRHPDIVVWSIKEAHFPNEDMLPREQILELLKSALREFRWTGYEDTYINGIAEVKFEF
jgi:hypothetical protein